MEFFTEIIDKIKVVDEQTLWALEIFTVILFTALANLAAAIFIKKIERRAEKTSNLWDDALVYAFRKPVRLLIWSVGLVIAAEVAFENNLENSLFYLAYPARDIAVIFAVSWFCLRFIRSIEEGIFSDENSHSLDKTTAVAITKILRLAIIITAVLIAMQTLGFSVTGVMAAGGVGGLAIGFAAKDLLANFFGALMIYLDRPFEVGDWIRSPDKEIEGTVEDIGWRQTRIRTFDKRPLYVPNAIFSTIAVQNPSRMSHRRIYETIGVRYDDMKKVKKISAAIKKMLKEHKEIDANQTLMVNLDKFDASSVNFFVYCFTKTTVWTKFHDVKQDVLLKIAKIIEDNGAEIAFPTRTLHTPELAGLVATKK